MSSIGGFFGTTPIQSGGYANSGPTIDQASQETLRVAAGMPQPIAESMLFGLGIAQWAARPQNADMFNQPEFSNAYNGLFGQNQNQIGRNVNTGNTLGNPFGNNNVTNGLGGINNNNVNNTNLRGLLEALIQRLGNQ